MLKRPLTTLIRLLTALLVIMVAGVTVLLYTEPGRTWLAETGLAAAASGHDYELTWRGIHSPKANQWTIDTLTLHRNNAVALTVSGIRLHWSPGTLLGGKIILDKINIERVTINKLNTASGPEPRIKNIFPVTVHAFSIKDLTLNTPNPAGAQGYSLSGSLALFKRNALMTTNTVITPVSGRGFRLSVTTTIKRDLSGSAGGRYEEQGQGPVSTFLKLANDEPFAASFHTGFNTTPSGFNINLSDLAFVFHKHHFVLRGQLQKADGIYKLTPLHIRTDNSEQLLTGTIKDSNLDLQLELHGLPLDLASDWTGRTVPGDASGQLTIQGTINAPHVSGRLTAETRYKSVPLSVTLAATATRNLLTLQQATVTTAKGTNATAAGRINLDDKKVDIQIDLNGLSTQLLQQLTASVPVGLTGDFNGRIGLKGPWRKPVVDFSGRFNGTYKNAGPLHLDVSGDGKPYTTDKPAAMQPSYEANLRRVELQFEKFDVTGEGHALVATKPFAMSIDDTRIRIGDTVHDLSGTIQGDRLALALHLNDFPLETISPLIDKPLTGTASARLFLGGTFAEPVLSGSFNSKLVYNTFPLRVQSDFDASRRWVELKQLKINNKQTSISAKGKLDLVSDDSDMVVHVNNLESMTLARWGLAIPNKIRGQLSSDLTVNGNWQLPRVTGVADFTGTWQSIPVTMQLTGSGSRERFSIDKLEAKAGNNGRLLLKGNYKNRLTDFDLEAHDLPAGLLRWDDWQPPDGVVAANMTLRGSADQPRVEGKVIFSPVTPATGHAAPQTGLQADIHLADERLNTRITLTGKNAHNDLINLAIPWRDFLRAETGASTGQLPLSGNLQAHVSLKDICPFLPDADINKCRGTLDTNLSLGGTYSLPELNGGLSVSDGYYENQLSGTSLDNIQIVLRAQGRQLQIVKATATDGGQGRLELSGQGQWRKNVSDNDINLSLKVNNSHVLRRYDMDGVANGTLSLTGNHADLLLSGKLLFQPFTLAMQSLLQQEEIPTLNVTDAEEQRHEPASRQKKQILPVIHMNVELAADQQAFLRGPGLEAELQGQLQVRGTYRKPVFQGYFKTLRGSAQILGKRFDLKNGELRLDDKIVTLSIPATYSSKDLEVRADLSGTLDHLHLALSSTPPYPEDEIISHLLFGQSSQDITPLQAVRLANAITALKNGGKPLFDPLGKLEKALSIDRLTLEDNSNSNGFLLGAGKYINDRVYVEVDTDTGAGQGWQGNVEVKLTPHLNLENTINSTSGFGSIGINWKKDY